MIRNDYGLSEQSFYNIYYKPIVNTKFNTESFDYWKIDISKYIIFHQH